MTRGRGTTLDWIWRRGRRLSFKTRLFSGHVSLSFHLFSFFFFTFTFACVGATLRLSPRVTLPLWPARAGGMASGSNKPLATHEPRGVLLPESSEVALVVASVYPCDLGSWLLFQVRWMAPSLEKRHVLRHFSSGA